MPPRIVKADPTFTALPPGYGPRHMTVTARTFESGHHRAYVINELQPYISIFKIDVQTGHLESQGEIRTTDQTDAEENAGAEITLHPNQQWLYCSNRVPSENAVGAIIAYRILEDGGLEKIQVFENYCFCKVYFI